MTIAVAQIPRHDLLVPHWSSAGAPALPLFGPTTSAVSRYAETALTLLLVLAFLLMLTGRSLGSVISVIGRVRGTWLGVCLLTASAVAVPGAVLLALADQVVLRPVAVTGGAGITATALVLVLAGLSTIAAELLFRGWYLQALGAEQMAWSAVAVETLGATIGHSTDFGIGGYAGHGVWGYTDLAVWAAVAGGLTIATGGLEAATAFALAWTGAQIAVAQLATGDPDPSRTAIATNGHGLAVHVAVAVAYTALVLTLARYRRIAVTVPDAPAAPTIPAGTKESTP
ncbi:hypothetical protein [Actinoplanes sp. NPDC051851]|uniref:hypothetical protein n=1 Tax=Actinoplanes sp. NPDC051851 TaxID=3154753 RepID=UPI003424CF1F